VSSRPAEHIPRAARLAFTLSRVQTWGLPVDRRASLLREALADWEAMAGDRTPAEVLWRALRGIPAAIWGRLDEHDTTALPAGVALTALGFGGLLAGGVDTAYPASLRASIVLSGIGALIFGLTLLFDPRRLRARNSIGAGIMAVGFAGMAWSIPTDDGWARGKLPQESEWLDLGLAVSFFAVGGGLFLVAIALTWRRFPTLISLATTVAMVGLISFSVFELVWALFVAPYDPAITYPTLAASLAAASAAHVIPRIRHLEIV